MEIAMNHGFAGRREDHRLVTGRGCFTADWNLPGQAYGCFPRWDSAHADITGLDMREAMSMPGVLLVLTGEGGRLLHRWPIRLLLQKQGFIFQAIPNYCQIGMTITYCCARGFS
jgi:CO/xanthine dehydrogenase Mo-binding subunit